MKYGTDRVKARICWRIRGHEGKGSPIPWRAAQDSAEKLNRQYGAGTDVFLFGQSQIHSRRIRGVTAGGPSGPARYYFGMK